MGISHGRRIAILRTGIGEGLGCKDLRCTIFRSLPVQVGDVRFVAFPLVHLKSRDDLRGHPVKFIVSSERFCAFGGDLANLPTTLIVVPVYAAPIAFRYETAVTEGVVGEGSTAAFSIMQGNQATVFIANPHVCIGAVSIGNIGDAVVQIGVPHGTPVVGELLNYTGSFIIGVSNLDGTICCDNTVNQIILIMLVCTGTSRSIYTREMSCSSFCKTSVHIFSMFTSRSGYVRNAPITVLNLNMSSKFVYKLNYLTFAVTQSSNCSSWTSSCTKPGTARREIGSGSLIILGTVEHTDMLLCGIQNEFKRGVNVMMFFKTYTLKPLRFSLSSGKPFTLPCIEDMPPIRKNTGCAFVLKK